MIYLALWIASALFLGYCALHVIGAVIVAIQEKRLNEVDRKKRLENQAVASSQPRRTARTGPGLSSYPPLD
jgi:hypothetical protein